MLIESFDGTELYTSSVGSGPPILLCDGLGCDGYIWRYLLDSLSHRHQVISWHYRGHGKSAPPRDAKAVGMPALRADLAAVMDHHGVSSAVLIGHSLGVQLILDFSLHWPNRVRGLVPICGSYGKPLDTLHHTGWLGRFFPTLRDMVLRWPANSQRLWRRFFNSRMAYEIARRFEVNKELVRAADLSLYFLHLANMDAQIFVRLLDEIRHHSVEDRLAEINLPTLIIAGERDSFTPAWLSERMHARIAGSELLIVPGGTHVTPIEIPGLVLSHVEQFLKDRVYKLPAIASQATDWVTAANTCEAPIGHDTVGLP